MYKILIILIIISIIFIGCKAEPEIITETIIETEYETIIETVVVTETVIKVDDKCNQELEQYRDLINNLNDMLSNVYYVFGSNANYESMFTAFSIDYEDRIYLITAGHCVHYNYDNLDTGVYTYFKAKANFSDTWIYPKLISYNNDFDSNKDYAILYADNIDSGLLVDNDNDVGKFVLGNNKLNSIRNSSIRTVDEESGSPMIDLEGEIIGIIIGDYTYTPIQLVLDNIE